MTVEHLLIPSFPLPDCCGPFLLDDGWMKFLQRCCRRNAPDQRYAEPIRNRGPSRVKKLEEPRRSAAQAQPLDERLIARTVFRLDVVEQPAALRHQFDQTPAGMIVLGVSLEVLRQIGNPF
jgi:hypothetical protein